MPLSQTRLVIAVALVSAAVLGHEIGLMRLLLVASWHHFAFLVISVALLGFGAGGTFLSLFHRRATSSSRAALTSLALLTALLIPLTTAMAGRIPIESRMLPALLSRQIASWVLLWLLLLLPFVTGAAVIALAMMSSPERLGGVYAANLLGSAAGALGAPALMSIIVPEWLPASMAIPALVAALTVAPVQPRWIATCAIGTAVAIAWLAIAPPRIQSDPYKYAGHVERLVEQGQARRIDRAFGPRAMVERYRSDLFHDVPFLATASSPPPPMDVLVVDGHAGGSILRTPVAIEMLDQTLMAAGYDLAPEQPRVLLLGATGNLDAALAATRDARRIDFVQPDLNALRLIAVDLPFDRLHVHVGDARHHVERTTREYDLIQLVRLQSTAAGSLGMAGMGEDHLVTVEGIAATLGRLAPGGVVVACRGIQSPPRDNLKLIATFHRALRAAGHTRPEEHLVVLRDFLAVCIVARSTPWTEADADPIRSLCATRNLTPCWFPSIRPDELNRPDELPGPEETGGDWYHHFVLRLVEDGGARFTRDWIFDIRPATDDRPFFLDFCRLRSVAVLRASFGPMWMTRIELALLFVVVATAIVVVLGAALTLLPWAIVGPVRHHPRLLPAGLYFTAIGLGYMLLEMSVLSHMTFMVADPVRSAALTITLFLVSSGIGSLLVQRFGDRLTARLPFVLAAVAAATAALWWVSVAGAPIAIRWPTAARVAAIALLIAPVGVLMGMPMPAALRRLPQPLIAWSWSVNGFASVAAVPIAKLTGMTWGYTVAATAAVVLYLGAALCAVRMQDAVSP
ncbi:MAG: hypothetical protein CMJ18_14315 [Phycisphaeraceae bacterium]|nr:hypothetical protein [Phycisphaeraceae bacterium]